MTNQAGYNFHPNDELWYLDSTVGSYKEGVCHQVEFEVFKKQDDTVETTLWYRVALNGASGTVKTREAALFISTEDGLVNGPLTPIYNANYEYYPGDQVWVADRVQNVVKYGTIYQIEIKIFAKVDLTSETKITYYIRYNDATANVRVVETDVFATAEAAWDDLGIVIGPVPTPVPTSTPTPFENIITVSKLNTDSIALPKCTPVYLKSDGTISRANIDSTALTFLGFVCDETIAIGSAGRVCVSGVLTATEAEWNAVIEGGVDLIDSETYYLSSLGKISDEGPDETGFSRQVGIATSETEFVIRIMPAVEL